MGQYLRTYLSLNKKNETRLLKILKLIQKFRFMSRNKEPLNVFEYGWFLKFTFEEVLFVFNTSKIVCLFFFLNSITFSFVFFQPVSLKVTKSCPTLCDPMNYTVHGILQARILEWVAFPFSRGFSQPISPVLQVNSL